MDDTRETRLSGERNHSTLKGRCSQKRDKALKEYMKKIMKKTSSNSNDDRVKGDRV